MTARRCACGSVATGTRVKGQWVPDEKCRRCLAMSRIGGVVEGLKRVAMRRVETELTLLCSMEAHMRTKFAGPELSKMFDDLDTLRELQKGEGK